MNARTKGAVTEYKIICQLLELGFSVSIPAIDVEDYDLIIELENKFMTVQCKTLNYREGRGALRANLENHNHEKYDPKRVHAFMFYSEKTDKVYWEQNAGQSTAYLSLSEGSDKYHKSFILGQNFLKFFEDTVGL